MRILQSTVEKLLYFLLILLFIVSISGGYFAYQDGQEIKQQIYTSHQANIELEQTIINNQNRLDGDLRNSVKCLFSLNQTSTPQEAQACFNVGAGKQ